ncbi:hypothetical protein [Streptomyces sp. NBC_01077]|uniref:hypothetical protein n=1 Tax=Streptomyces sp. NBC_01077 TaxID=2903746 RepID=UPI00386BE8E7
MILDPVQWDEFLEGEAYVDDAACQQAAIFAARNDAELLDDRCVRLPAGNEGFEVTVRTTGTVGRSIIPGTESRHATASAKAVIEPRCTFAAPENPVPEPSPGEPEEEPGQEDEPIVGLTCDGEAWEIDPDDPTLPSAADLFTVRLSGDDE